MYWEAWSNHSQPSNHANACPAMGKRCTHKYGSSSEQWKMLTVEEGIMRKTTTQHQYTYVWNSSWLTSCGGWCWGLFAAWRKLMCPYEYTNKPHRCNFQYSSPGSAKKTIFSTSTVSLLADEGIPDICLESDTGGQRDSRRARASYSKRAAAFKSQPAKAKPRLGRGCKTASLL